ncbi:YoaK family protein [Williamsia soli]|uniref:YoaK family protein n=1 Tax=Williamsia soli TaxID=364929 RepID=UPI001A9DD148|nr:YoaK family protein [Williamsia soli]
MTKPTDETALGRRVETRGLVLMLALTFVTGVVDAVGFLGLDRVFVGNMTGNIVILGMGVAGADELPVLGPAVALGTFVAGALIAGMVLRSKVKGWTTAVTGCLAAGSVILVGAALAATLTDVKDDLGAQIAVAAATAAAMGVQACVARKVAIADMTTVVVTSTLTSLAAETWIRGGREALWNRRLGAIALIFLGAVIGALILAAAGVAVALTLAAVLSLVVTFAGHRYVRTAATEA